jgi:uncharacterized phage protein gp47/JayE
MTTTPDVTPYVDLSLYDVDAQPLFDRALTELTTRFPDWTPREGNTEVVLLEAMALQVSEMVYAINRLPGAIVEVLLRMYGLDRDPGLPPSATALITVGGVAGYTVPAGTRLRLPLGGAVLPLDFLTTVDLVIEPGDTSGTVPISGDTATTVGFGTPAGVPLQVVTPVLFVERAELASEIVAGREPEDAGGFLNRGVARLQRLVTTLVLPEHFTAAAVEEPYVARATTIDNYDPGQVGSPGAHGGHVTVAVLGPAGSTVSEADRDALDAKLEGMSLAMLNVHVIPVTLTPVPVTVTVVREPDAVEADVVAAVTAALAEYLSPETGAFGGKVYWSEVISVIDQAAGVQRVASLTAPAADVTLAGVAPLATLGAVSVTVQAP